MTEPETPGFPPPPRDPQGQASPAEAAPVRAVEGVPTPAPPPRPGPSPGAIAFGTAVRALTPRGFVTETLIALNVLVYVAMVAKGVSPTSPKVADLLTWGANLAARTSGGEWWRLLTCTFVHIGALHIAMNMYVLWSGGRTVERILGNAGFLVAYLTAGFAGSFASMLWSPYVVSAGASGAVFGVYGALLGFLARERTSIPADVLQGLGKNAVVFLGYNVMLGMSIKGIDMAAHLGGLGGGFLAGLALAHPLTPEGARGRWLRTLVVALVAAGAVVAGTFLVPHPLDVDAELGRFDAAQKVFNDGVRQVKANELNDDGFADLVDKKVLPPWREARTRIAKVTGLPPEMQRMVAAVQRSAETRQEAFELVVRSVRDADTALMQQANAKQVLADEQLAPLKEGAKK